MYRQITPEQLNAACKLAAESLNIDENEFKRAVFDEMQLQYDREDVITWLNEEGYAYNDDDVEKILSTMRNDWNSDLGTWSNIESAYNNNDMHLPYADNECAGKDHDDEDDVYGCRVAFPQCQKCKISGECDAYQHALSACANVDQLTIDAVFTDDDMPCETFEPINELDDEERGFDCSNCNSHCSMHADCHTAMERVRKLEEEISNE